MLQFFGSGKAMVESITFGMYYKSNVGTKTLQNIFDVKLKFN